MMLHIPHQYSSHVLVCAVLFALLATATLAQAPPTAGDFAIRVVQQGETVTSIATDEHVSPSYLALYNRMSVMDPLTPGMLLLVPQISGDITTATSKPPTVNPTPQPPPTVNPTPTPTLPQTATGSNPPTTPPVSSADSVSGVIGTVTAEKTQILSRPTDGTVLYDKATRGLKLLVIGQNGDYYAVLMEEGTIGWAAKADVELTSITKTVPKPKGATIPASQPAGRTDVIDAAKKYMGVRYVYGGHLPDSVDCSLLVQTAFHECGIDLPRTAADQYQVGTPVDVKDLLPGDRLYFYKPGEQEIGHAAIYIGNGQFIHASSNRGMVAIDTLGDETYWDIYAGARRS